MADLARRNHFVLTDHDETALRGFSAASDLRVVWGGDATVEQFRRFRSPSAAGMSSFRTGIRWPSWMPPASPPSMAGLGSLADRFFDDAFWFDQGACSSPRLLLWRAADDPDDTERAVQRFHDAVLAATKRHSSATRAAHGPRSWP